MVPSLPGGLLFCSFVDLFSVVCASVVPKIEGCQEGKGPWKVGEKKARITGKAQVVFHLKIYIRTRTVPRVRGGG